jgi:outer membrane lipoprotein-sorting protein
MKKVVLSFLLLVGLSVSESFAASSAETREIVSKMLKAIQQHTGAEYVMKGVERLPGKQEYRTTELFTRINVAPLKIYARLLSDPNKGTEMLYVKGQRGDKILVNAGKFLPNVKLPHTSSLLTKDQHHTILRSGFKMVVDLIGDGVKRADKQNGFEKAFRIESDIMFQGRPCYKLVIEDPTYQLTSYKAQAGEMLDDIARKLLIPEYAIMEWNGVKSFETDLGGKNLKVPSSYAKKSVLYIDKQHFFPLYQELWDDKGVFEKYEYSNLKISPNFDVAEFTESGAGYSF